jgi:hypothetical protein
MKNTLFVILTLLSLTVRGQNFTYSGYIYNANSVGAVNVPVKLYKRTTPTLVGFTSQTNYNGHSYYRSTGTATWTASKSSCESMNGHLVTMSNAAENTFVYNTWPSGWIGYYQDRVAGFSYSEPLGGYRWTELPVTNGLQSDYDVASYTSGASLVDIKGGVNATLTNSPTYTSTSGKYLTFNGVNQYGMTGNLALKVPGVTTSLMMWIYPTGNGVIVTELGQGTTTSGWHNSQIEITGGNTLRVGIWNTNIVSLSTSITLNTWNLVGFTYNGTTLKGYKNGVSFGSLVTPRQSPVLYGNGLYYGIGLSDATNMGSGAYGSFRLGDFQVFDRGITDDEVNRIYNLYAYRYGIYPYSNWNPGEPNNSANEDYTQFVSGGKWNDLNNSSSLNYVLEFDYIVDYTPWVLFKTINTDVTGKYTINETTNPSVEWYIQIDAPTTITGLQNVDAIGASTKAISRTFTSLDYYKYDVNNDGNITVSDEYYIFMKKINRFISWGSSLPSVRLFTSSQFSIINTSTTDLRSTYPGVQNITISSPVSGGSANYYLINTGYSNSTILGY